MFFLRGQTNSKTLEEKKVNIWRPNTTIYNPLQAKESVLYPCYSIVIQFYVVTKEDKLTVSMNMYQRSGDLFLGVPFNLVSNALLIHLVCNTLNKRVKTNIYIPHKLHIILGYVHIYHSHIEATKTQIKKCPYEFPTINIICGCVNLKEYQ